jgi:hypothetical protein
MNLIRPSALELSSCRSNLAPRARAHGRHKKDSTINSNTKKEDELFIPNALETDNKFKVSCSVAALLMFLQDKDFKGNTTRGEAFQECDNCRPSPLSDMWQNILLKQPTEKLSKALHTILTHQEVRPSALGGVPPFHKNTLLTGTLMDNFCQGNWACRDGLLPTVEEI